MLRFELDRLPGQESMLVFHALVKMGIESLVIVSPARPLISVGYFQDAEQERLERRLSDVRREPGDVYKRVEQFYDAEPVESPGVEVENDVKAMDLDG